MPRFSATPEYPNQMADATADMLFDGTFRNAEMNSAFALRQAVDLAQNECLPALGWKLCDSFCYLPQLLPAFSLNIRGYLLRLHVEPIELTNTIDRNDLRPAGFVHQNGKGCSEEIGPRIGDVIDRRQQGQLCIGLLHDIIDIIAKGGAARQPAAKRRLVRADVARQPLGPVGRNHVHEPQWMMNGA